MKIIKLLVISAVVLFLLLTAISSLLPPQVRISRAVDIRVRRQKVFEQLAALDHWPAWNEYARTLTGTALAPHSIHSNELDVVITRADSAAVHTLWTQANGKRFPAVFNLVSHGDLTTVQWYFTFSFRWYPWEKFSSIVYDKQLGPQMEQSLNNLREMLEKAP